MQKNKDPHRNIAPCLNVEQFFWLGEYIIKHIKNHLAAEITEKTDDSLNIVSPELPQQKMEPRGDLYLQDVKFGYMLCANESYFGFSSKIIINICTNLTSIYTASELFQI